MAVNLWAWPAAQPEIAQEPWMSRPVAAILVSGRVRRPVEPSRTARTGRSLDGRRWPLTDDYFQ
jgi:hypothetical protein